MPKREIVEQDKFLKWARLNKYVAICIQTKGPYGTKGFNDVLALGPYSCNVFFEFKREKKKPEPLQRYRHRQLKKLGHPTHVVYTSEQAQKIFKEAILQAMAISRNVHQLRPKPPCRWILTAARSRKDNDHTFYLLDSPPPWVC